MLLAMLESGQTDTNESRESKPAQKSHKVAKSRAIKPKQ